MNQPGSETDSVHAVYVCHVFVYNSVFYLRGNKTVIDECKCGWVLEYLPEIEIGCVYERVL